MVRVSDFTNASGPGYEHLALFTAIAPPAMMFARPKVHTSARVVDSFVPKTALPITDETRPRLTIEAEAATPVGTPSGFEFTWRLDGGPWNFWTPSSTLLIDSPMLRLPGNHDIEVRGRVKDQPTTADDTPTHLSFAVDYSPPKVTLALDPATNEVVTGARDDATPADRLSFRYAIGTGVWSQPGAAHPIPLSELGSRPWLRVEATDLAGHSAVAAYGTPVLGNSTWVPKTAGGKSGGCAEGGVSLMALFGGLGLLRRRRKT